MPAPSRFTQLKLIAAAVAALVVVIVVMQNMESVQTRILFLTVAMPRALLLLVTLLVGFALGLVTAGKWASWSRRE